MIYMLCKRPHSRPIEPDRSKLTTKFEARAALENPPTPWFTLSNIAVNSEFGIILGTLTSSLDSATILNCDSCETK